ncbi:MAG: cupin domain-containing protein [Planctomycetota bacterium]|jgi:quercetin dioxygenase-like cupin family protein
MKVKLIEAHEQTPVNMEGAKGVTMRMLIGREDGAPNFHMRHFTVAPGGHTPHHQHDYEHEVLILSGSGVVKSEQGDRPCQKDAVVFVPANEKHQFRNTGPDPLEFICLIPAPEDCSR